MRLIYSLLFFTILMNFALSQVSPDTLKGEIQLRTYIDNENVPLNREVIYHIELRWPGDLSQYSVSDLTEPVVTNLTLRGSGSSNKVTPASDGKMISVKTITYYFRPLEIGMAYIDGVAIKYLNTVADRESSLLSGRVGVKIVEPIPDPSEEGIFSGWFGYLIVLIFLGAVIYIYAHYKKKQEEENKKDLVELSETIEQKYLRLLKETIHFNTDNIKDSLNDLTHLLNGYFSERYQIPAFNLAEDDLIDMLKEKDLADESLSRIKDFYAKSNLVKFAGEMVDDSEFHRLYDTIELVLENQNKLFDNHTSTDPDINKYRKMRRSDESGY